MENDRRIIAYFCLSTWPMQQPMMGGGVPTLLGAYADTNPSLSKIQARRQNVTKLDFIL